MFVIKVINSFEVNLLKRIFQNHSPLPSKIFANKLIDDKVMESCRKVFQ